MRKRILVMLPILMMSLGMVAQKSYFHSLNDAKKNTQTSNSQVQIADSVMSNQIDPAIRDSSLVLQKHVDKQRNSGHTSKKMASRYKNDPVLSYYEGDSHELNMLNVLRVMNEVGINNQFIVLAQSLLETGFYKSNVCLSHYNLFGLRNPKTGRYYRFERWEDSVIGYKKFVQYKYKEGNYFSFLKRIGYAEDPLYIYKVAKITRQLASGERIID